MKTPGLFFESGAVIPLIVLTLWQYGTRAGWWSAYILPGPFEVLKSLADLAASGELFRNTASSVTRVLKGFSLSAAIALAAAFVCGVYRPMLNALSPAVNFLRHVPPMAMIPMLILWFGIGEASKAVIIIMAAFFPIFLNAVQGVSQCDRRLLEAARVFGYTRAQELRWVVLPSALPYVLTGMRLGLGYSWRSLIAAELVAASSGLGYMIWDAEQLAKPEVILAGVLVIGCLGAAMDAALSWLSVRFAPYGAANGMA